MNRKLASGLSFAAMAVAAAVAAMLSPPPAFADDITVETAPFVSSRTTKRKFRRSIWPRFRSASIAKSPPISP